MMTTLESKPVLDHGYVSLITTWGTEEGIIEAARMSTNKGFQGWEETCNSCGGLGYYVVEACSVACSSCLASGKIQKDSKLLRYLYTNKHYTPFEMAGLIIEVKAPIFVFREWHRHRTQSYNEMSARYVPLPNENYEPTLERIKASAGGNKQAQGTKPLAKDKWVSEWIGQLYFLYDRVEEFYNKGLALGIPKEVARIVLPVGRYSKMRASANLRNWLHFLELRDAPGAQYEIREYAKAVAELIKEKFPRTYELATERQITQ